MLFLLQVCLNLSGPRRTFSGRGGILTLIHRSCSHFGWGGCGTSTGAGEAKNEESQSVSVRQNCEQISTGDHRTPQEMGER